MNLATQATEERNIQVEREGGGGLQGTSENHPGKGLRHRRIGTQGGFQLRTSKLDAYISA